MLNRDEIIEYLKDFAINKDYVYAMWLEGADGVNRVDEYSDIDFWFDVEKTHQESFLQECIDRLKVLGNIDSQVDEIRKEIAQSNIHLENTNEYLTLDICVQSHQIRGKEATIFINNDIAERPKVIFDKKNIITYKNEELDKEKLKEIFNHNKYRIKQQSRVTKYIKRNEYLEAYMKYISNIADPLVKIARLIYTPRHTDYVLCHINTHLPKDVVEELEKLYKVTNFNDIENNLDYANRLLEKYEEELKNDLLI